MLMMIYLARKNADSTSSEQAVTPEHRVLTGGGQR
jgi:hypothetical protein